MITLEQATDFTVGKNKINTDDFFYLFFILFQSTKFTAGNEIYNVSILYSNTPRL